jgi:hypothetical protein
MVAHLETLAYHWWYDAHLSTNQSTIHTANTRVIAIIASSLQTLVAVYQQIDAL